MNIIADGTPANACGSTCPIMPRRGDVALTERREYPTAPRAEKKCKVDYENDSWVAEYSCKDSVTLCASDL